MQGITRLASIAPPFSRFDIEQVRPGRREASARFVGRQTDETPHPAGVRGHSGRVGGTGGLLAGAHALGHRKRAFVHGTPCDDALYAAGNLAKPLDIAHAGHTAEAITGRPNASAIRTYALRIYARLHAVARDVGVHEVPKPQLRHMARQLLGCHARALAPTRHGHLPRPSRRCRP